jgi:rhodanese-related sulfurtransferase
MLNFYGAPEISVFEVDHKMKAGENFILLDVRESDELKKSRLIHPNVHFSPLSRINREKLKALPERALQRDEEIIVICHHGIRSALVTAWLRNEGWKNVFSMDGGLAAYARHIDPSVGSY